MTNTQILLSLCAIFVINQGLIKDFHEQKSNN